MRRPLLIAALIAVALLAPMTSAGLGATQVLLGNNSVESLRDNDAAGLAEAFSFGASASGSAQSIFVYVDSGSRASGLVVGLYADNGGDPGKLLASGSNSGPAGGQWNQVTLDSSPTLSSGATYWLAVLGTGGQLNFRDIDPGTGNCSNNSYQSNLTSLPSSWTSGIGWNTCSISAYVNGGGGSTAAPANTALPAISGRAVQGQTLTASNGSWSGSPTSYAYQWQDCDSTGANCTDISGATSSRYTLASGDVRHTIDVVVTATNAGSSTSAASSPSAAVTDPVPPSAPTSTVAPAISGTVQQGQTLTTSNGSWNGSPTSYGYQWQDCDTAGNNCTTIGGATSGSYTVASRDVGHTILAIVTARNASGSTPATSAQTRVVSGSTAGCSGAANTPGGPDPWGGCFPGANNTGVPAGTNLVTVNSSAQDPPNAALPSDNRGWDYSSSDGAIDITQAGAVIDGVSSSGVNDWVAGAGFTLKNSTINGVIANSGANGAILIENSTINGGQQASTPTVGVSNVTVEDSNLYGGKDLVNCEGNNCTVQNSYLHDNYNGGSSAHQQGFFADGNSNDILSHNSIYCTGGCTADVTLATAYPTNGVSASKNLLVASPNSDLCVYPGPNAAPLVPPTVTVANVSWTDNVFQRGQNGECGYYGPVYGWYPSQCTPTSSCTWTGNMWDDGTALNEPNQ